MKTLALLFSLLLGSVHCAPVYSGMSIAAGQGAHTHSDASTGGGTLSLSGTLSSTKACASGYTRVGPNYCANDDHSSTGTAWADAAACTARTLTPAVPADAKLIILNLQWRALSNNAVASRSNFVQFWTSATCTGASDRSFFSDFNIREMAATAAGTTLADVRAVVFVEPGAENTVYTTQSNAGGNGNADVIAHWVIGYFD